MKLTIFLIVLNLLPLGACKTVNSSSPSEAVEKANALEGVFRVSNQGATATLKYKLKLTILSKAYLNTTIIKNDIGPSLTEARQVTLELQNAIKPTFSKDDTTFVLRHDEKKVESILYKGLKGEMIEQNSF